MSNITYFDILGITKEATQEEVNDAYIKLVKQSKINKKINLYLINEAYEVLKHPLKRFNYERSLEINEMKNNNFDNITSVSSNLKNINNITTNNEEFINNLLRTNPNLSKEQIENIIKSNTDDEGNLTNITLTPEEFMKFIRVDNEPTINITSDNIEQLKDKRQTEINDILIQEQPINQNITNEDFNKLFEQKFNKQTEPILYNNLNDDNDNYTLLTLLKKEDNKQIHKNNEQFDIIHKQMEHARETNNIKEYIRLRDEEQRIITNF